MLKGAPVKLEVCFDSPFLRIGPPCRKEAPFVFMPGLKSNSAPLYCCSECKRIIERVRAGYQELWPLNPNHRCGHRRLVDFFYHRNPLQFINLPDQFSQLHQIRNYVITVPFGFLRFRDVDLPTELKTKVWWIIVMLFLQNIEFQRLGDHHEHRERDEEANQKIYAFLKEKAFVSQ